MVRLRRANSAAVLLVVISLGTWLGCGGAAELLAYLGGGLPPGETDLGGVVLAAAPAAAASSVPQQGPTPVEGAAVTLWRGTQQLGQTTTGAGGYFRFVNPDTGAYTVRVRPPAGSGLQAGEQGANHTRGQQTFLTIMLAWQAGAGGP